jgi:hypothetical protein
MPLPVIEANVVERRLHLGFERPGTEPRFDNEATVDQKNAQVIFEVT